MIPWLTPNRIHFVVADTLREIDMLAGSSFAPPIECVSLGHNDLSHHGKDPSKLEQLKIVELETMKTVRDLLAKLKQSQEDDSSLLERTTVFLGRLAVASSTVSTWLSMRTIHPHCATSMSTCFNG